jgi:plasmid stabilization system protein ParE
VADLRFDAAAIADITLARDWYERERTGLGNEFIDSTEVAVGRLMRFPGCGALVGSSLRRQPLERFPYVLYYRSHGTGILVIACLHVARGPEYRICRLRG